MKTKKEIYQEIEKEILHSCKDERYYSENEYKSLFFENQILIDYINYKNLAKDLSNYKNFKFKSDEYKKGD
jgi:hypothetical protein